MFPTVYFNVEWDKVTELYEVEDWKESTVAYFNALKFQEMIYLLTADLILVLMVITGDP
jgi:ABC-type lipoprotein release transport system permease subunit